MRIKVFKSEKEYWNNKDYSYDCFVLYFSLPIKPTHNVPIIWLLTSYDEAKKRGFSSYAATIGWTQPNFPEVTEDKIEQLCQDYLDGKLDLGLIPAKFRNHLTSRIIGFDDKCPSYIADMRMKICEGCPLFDNNICMACGCNLCDKTKIANESCPEHKWGKYFQEVIKPSNTSILNSSVKHIMYYMWNNNSDIIGYHLDKLLRTIDIFNGERIATVVDGDANLLHKLDSMGFKTIIRGTNQSGEYPAESYYFHQMLSKLPKDGLTFYGHAKGVSYATKEFNEGPVKLWCENLYNSCLFGYNDHLSILEQNIFSGSMLRTNRKTLVYPGTFFWFKNKDVFDLNWQLLDNSYGGVEYWPGKITNNQYMGAADSTGKDNDFLDLYSLDFWTTKVKPTKKSCECKNG